VVKLVSDPELPDAEKLAWLVLGHGPETMSGGDAAVLLSAAGGLLGNDSGGVVQQVKKTFGIDEIGVRQGNIGDTGSRQLSSRVAGSGGIDTSEATGNQILSVGKRLSSNALLSYEQTLGRAEGIVKLTVNLTRQIAVVGRAGSDNALDIYYTLTFGRSKEKAEGK
jgi:translocation and assembly module TamB